MTSMNIASLTCQGKATTNTTTIAIMCSASNDRAKCNENLTE